MHTLTHALTHAHTLSLTYTLTLIHTLTHTTLTHFLTHKTRAHTHTKHVHTHTCTHSLFVSLSHTHTLTLTHTHAVLHFHNHHQLRSSNLLYFHNNEKVLHHSGLRGDLRQCPGDPAVGGGAAGVPRAWARHLPREGEDGRQEQRPCARDHHNLRIATAIAVLYSQQCICTVYESHHMTSNTALAYVEVGVVTVLH